jgi:hypothetical protein
MRNFNRLSVFMGFALVGCGERSGPATGTPAYTPKPAPELAVPAESHLRRLTARQYANAIRDLFGPDVVVASRLEPDVPVEGLVAIAASRTTISPRGVEQFETSAYEIATQALAPGPVRDALVTCMPSGTTRIRRRNRRASSPTRTARTTERGSTGAHRATTAPRAPPASPPGSRASSSRRHGTPESTSPRPSSTPS